jgi:hypothetical protein
VPDAAAIRGCSEAVHHIAPTKQQERINCMLDLLSIFDPNHDYDCGIKAGHDAGLIEQILHDAIPFASEGFKAGYEDGLADQNNGW